MIEYTVLTLIIEYTHKLQPLLECESKPSIALHCVDKENCTIALVSLYSCLGSQITTFYDLYLWSLSSTLV